MRRFDRRFWLGVFTTLWIGLAFGVAQAGEPEAEPRIALVIGAASYPDAKLATPLNDASLIAATLKSAGFDVTGAANPDQNQLRQLLRDFLRKAQAAGPDMQAFVYFSGRAIQYEGDNYLVPVDARIAHASDAPLETVRLEDFTHALAEAPALARIIVVDGARANPYAKEGRPLAGGLELMAPGQGALIGFNAAPGAIGADSPGPYGVYTKTLVEQMRQGGAPIEDVFSRTRLAVNQATGGAVAPWSVSKLSAPYFLVERDADAPPLATKLPPLSTPLRQLSPAEAYSVAVLRDTQPSYEEFLADFPNAAEATRVRAMLAARREALIWRESRKLNTPQAYWTYLKLYPRGPHAGDAERALEALGAATTPPKDFQEVSYGDVGSPTPAELGVTEAPYYYFAGPGYGPPPAETYSFTFPDANVDWQNLPAPEAAIGATLPLLPFGFPLPPHTRPHHHHHDRSSDDGRPGGASPETTATKPAPRSPAAVLGTGGKAALPNALGARRSSSGAPDRWRPSRTSYPLASPRPQFNAPLATSGSGSRWAPRSATVPQWRSTSHLAPALGLSLHPQVYLAPRIASPAPLLRPVAPGPVFRAAPTFSPAVPHFAAPHPVLLAPAARP